MASVTQQVPTLTGGISQQADELKVPGQVNVAQNVLPDITNGLMKRPGGQFVGSLSDGNNNAVDNGRWFHYYRDEEEQYIGQVSRTGDINMWKCSDGSEMNVYTGGIPWTASTAFIVGDRVTNNSNIYECDTDGTSAASGGPSGTSADITDGSTRWDYIGPVSTLNTQIVNYLTHTNDEDIQSLTVNDFTFFTNRTKEVGMAATVEPIRPPEAFIELETIKYANQYGLNLFSNTTLTDISTATRIRVDAERTSNNYCDTNGAMDNHTNRLVNSNRCLAAAGDGRDEVAPNVGTRVFDVSSNEQITDYDAVSTSGSSDFSYNLGVYRKPEAAQAWMDATNNVIMVSLNNHGYAVNDYFYLESDNIPNGTYQVTGVSTNTITVSYTTSTSASIHNVTIAKGLQTGRKNLNFRLTTTGQSTPVGSGSNIEYRTRYTHTHDLLYGGEGWQEGDFFYVYMLDAYYKITIEANSVSQVQANLGLIRPDPTSFETKQTVTAESILGNIREEILGTNYSGNNSLYQWRHDPSNGYYVEQIGTGLYISRPTSEGAFKATTTNSSLMNVVAGEILTVEDLPKQCKHGMVIRVANSNQTEDDDYYVKFFGNNDLDGEGVWEECAMPGTQIEYDKATMPLKLVRHRNLTDFVLDQVDYEVANAGDTNAEGGTNPRASFVGKTINKMIFFRNRLVMLSDANVIMSRPGNFFNYWAKTATTFSNIDVIDISVSSEYPAIVFDAIQVNAGLVIFTKNQQFMLTTDSDLLNPSTAKINSLSTYNFNFKTNPISLGTTIGFLDNANKYSRFFEMSRIQREGEPTVVEQSKVVSELFSKDLKLISNSRENSMIFFSEEGTEDIFGYRYFNIGEERGLSSWFSWKVTGNIVYHCMLDDALYVVVENGTASKRQLLKYSVKLDTGSHFVTQSNVDYPIHLDHSMETNDVVSRQWTYDPTTNKTYITRPTGIEKLTDLVAYDNTNTTTGTNPVQNLGRFGQITYTSSNNRLNLDGDWSSDRFIIGYNFEMKVQLPTIYVQRAAGENWRSDTRADLIVHRIKFSFGDVGVYSITIDREGKGSYTEQIEVNKANQILPNTSSFLPNSIETVPCYERNKSLTVTISSTHPSPSTLISYNWEGEYNNKSYSRV